MKQEDLNKIKSWLGTVDIMKLIEYAYICGKLDHAREGLERLRDPKDIETEKYLRDYYSGEEAIYENALEAEATGN